MEREVEDESEGGAKASETPSNGREPASFLLPDLDDVDSACSTPFYSAPSSPGRSHTASSGYYFSAPASPMHYVLSSSPYTSAVGAASSDDAAIPGSYEFEFSARMSGNGSGGAAYSGSMISADELFLNGQIRPMKLSSHLQRPQVLAPLLDLEVEDEVEEEEEEPKQRHDEVAAVTRGRDLRLRSRSLHRRARSMSPLRNAPPPQWQDEEEEPENVQRWRGCNATGVDADEGADPDLKQGEEKEEGEEGDGDPEVPTPSVSASSSRSSSSSGRNSKKWIFLKDLLYRSKSEGRGNGKEKFWHNISFSPAKEKTSLLFSKAKFKEKKEKEKDSSMPATPTPSSSTTSIATSSAGASAPVPSAEPKKQKSAETAKKVRPTNGVGKRKASAHERHYTANRAQAEELRRRTFLPYRQGLLGCLGFSSRGYGAMNGFARTLNTVSSR